MKRKLISFLFIVVAAGVVGCSKSGDDYDPNKIAVKQPGDGPPPMSTPMDGGQGTAPAPGGGTNG